VIEIRLSKRVRYDIYA